MTGQAKGGLTTVFVWTCCLLLLVQQILKQWSGGALSSIDQALVIAIFLWGIYLQTMKQRGPPRLVLLVLGLYAYLTVISVIFGSQTSLFAILIQNFIHLEFFIMAAGFYLILSNRDVSFRKLFIGLIVVTLIGCFANLAAGGYFFQILQVTPNKSALGLSYAFRGVSRLSGFQLNPNATGTILALGAIYLLALIRYRTSRPSRLYLFLAALLVLVILTGSRTAIGIAAIGFLFMVRPKSLPIQIAVIVVGVSLIAITQSDIFNVIYQKTLQNIQQLSNTGTTNYARWVLLGSGFQLAMQHFPIGSGAATFGSVMSYGSSVYGALGLFSDYSIMNGSTLFDSNLATILGEFGFLGIVLFYGLYEYAIVKMQHLIRGRGGNNSIFSATSMTFFFVGVLITIVLPLFVNSYNAAMLLIAMLATQQTIHAAELRRRAVGMNIANRAYFVPGARSGVRLPGHPRIDQGYRPGPE